MFQSSLIVLNYLKIVLQRFSDQRCFLAAGSLSYTTFLAVVPAMAIAFAIFSGFPAFRAIQDDIERFIFSHLAPHSGQVVQDYLRLFVANASELPSMSILLLAISVLILYYSIEEIFNAIWEQAAQRPMLFRILSFWAFLTLLPLLGGVAFSLLVQTSQYLNGSDWLSDAALLPDSVDLTPFISLLIYWAGFTLTYWIVPHARVAFHHALTGGLAATLLFKGLLWGFSYYITALTSYEAIYGILASIPVLMVWMYSSWVVMLFGAVVAATFVHAIPSKNTGAVAPS